MISHRPIAFVCISLLLLSGVTPAAQKREASKEVRSKLFKQLLAEDRELRECIQQEEGGVGAAEEGTTVEEVDLNRDGVPEDGDYTILVDSDDKASTYSMKITIK